MPTDRDDAAPSLDPPATPAPPADAELAPDGAFPDAARQLSSDAVAKPVRARYGWANVPDVNLWNKAGLPATPFRTDDFPGRTAPKK